VDVRIGRMALVRPTWLRMHKVMALYASVKAVTQLR
jgi:hypothetical protein